MFGLSSVCWYRKIIKCKPPGVSLIVSPGLIDNDFTGDMDIRGPELVVLCISILPLFIIAPLNTSTLGDTFVMSK